MNQIEISTSFCIIIFVITCVSFERVMNLLSTQSKHTLVFSHDDNHLINILTESARKFNFTRYYVHMYVCKQLKHFISVAILLNLPVVRNLTLYFSTIFAAIMIINCISVHEKLHTRTCINTNTRAKSVMPTCRRAHTCMCVCVWYN